MAPNSQALWLSRTLRQSVPAWLLLEADERKLKTSLGHHDEFQPQRPDSGHTAVLSVYCPALEALGTKRSFLDVVETTDVGETLVDGKRCDT